MEYLDVLDENGVLTGKTIEKAEAHIDGGEWHKTVHVWIVNNKGEILLQRRSPNKSSGANMLDISAAGHMQAGESSLEGVRREVEEETGLVFDKKDLEFICCIKNKNESKRRVNKEFADIYILDSHLKIENMILQADEVSEVIWVKYEEFKNMVKNRQEDLIMHDAEYKVLINALDKKFIHS